VAVVLDLASQKRRNIPAFCTDEVCGSFVAEQLRQEATSEPVHQGNSLVKMLVSAYEAAKRLLVEHHSYRSIILLHFFKRHTGLMLAHVIRDNRQADENCT
jgi:hypothetical protein